MVHRSLLSVSQSLSSLTYCQVGRAVAGLQTGRAIVFISLPLNTALGEKRGKVGEERGEEGWRTILGGSVATRQRVYHNSCCPQGKLGSLHQRLIHSPPLPSDTHTQPRTQAYAHSLRETSCPSIQYMCKIHPKKKTHKRLILRLKEVMFQPLLPKLLVVGSEVCFYDCSGFCVNELKFHLSGAPCICQHILQIES